MECAPAETDFVVIGAGIAGLRAAIELASAGRVVVLAKREVKDSATQGGIAAALSDEDGISLHLQDTLNAGDGLCNPEAARALVEDAPERIEELIQWGTEFGREGTKLTFGREEAHSRNRILHAHGDSTGREILRALVAKAKTLKQVSVCEFEFTTDLCIEDGQLHGVHLINSSGETGHIAASSVLLASGGVGQLYRNTTNPPVATGDGVAMAFRAGAEVSDMEFIQFHPTPLYLKNAPRFLHNLVITGDLIPSRPAAHYASGGVRTDLQGRTSLPALYAAGEAATTGVHGANRLASNSLLEGLVFGARAGRKMRDELRHGPAKARSKPRVAYSNGPVDAGLEELVREMQELMWNEVGIVRDGVRLKRAIEHLERLAPRVARPKTRRSYEASNILTAGVLVARSALAREESHGAHYRTDFPAHDDKKFLKHSVVKGDSIWFA